MSTNFEPHLQHLSEQTPLFATLPYTITCPEYIPYVPTNLLIPTASSTTNGCQPTLPLPEYIKHEVYSPVSGLSQKPLTCKQALSQTFSRTIPAVSLTSPVTAMHLSIPLVTPAHQVREKDSFPATRARETFPTPDFHMPTLAQLHQYPATASSFGKAPKRQISSMRFSPTQLDLLKTEFDNCCYISTERMKELATELGVGTEKISRWCSNRRVRMRFNERFRSRAKFSPTQLNTLEEEFDNCGYISKEKKRKLEVELGITTRIITSWFQNQRRLFKNISLIQPSDLSSPPAIQLNTRS